MRRTLQLPHHTELSTTEVTEVTGFKPDEYRTLHHGGHRGHGGSILKNDSYSVSWVSSVSSVPSVVERFFFTHPTQPLA
jgi:hypothetical protein